MFLLSTLFCILQVSPSPISNSSSNHAGSSDNGSSIQQNLKPVTSLQQVLYPGANNNFHNAHRVNSHLQDFEMMKVIISLLCKTCIYLGFHIFSSTSSRLLQSLHFSIHHQQPLLHSNLQSSHLCLHHLKTMAIAQMVMKGKFWRRTWRSSSVREAWKSLDSSPRKCLLSKLKDC